MLRTRVIPVLSLQGRSMVKTTQFADPLYLGDPMNALRIFNTKEVDELIILDITASREGRSPDLGFVRELASECFMPVCFGGGLTTVEEAEAVLKVGIEKIAFNTALFDDPVCVKRAAAAFGQQAIVGSMNVKRRRLGGLRVARSAPKLALTDHDPVEWAKHLQDDVGEIFLMSVDRDGTAAGYDEDLVRRVSHAVQVPVIACGGAATRDDLSAALRSGASAAAAGRMFVTRGKHRAALISYLKPEEVESLGR